MHNRCHCSAPLGHDKWVHEENKTIRMCICTNIKASKLMEQKPRELKRKVEKSTITLRDFGSFLDNLSNK